MYENHNDTDVRVPVHSQNLVVFIDSIRTENINTR
jgi:hypothetical protein